MSVANPQDQDQEILPTALDLSDLGTVSQGALEADRESPARRAERESALSALDALERDGRLLLG